MKPFNRLVLKLTLVTETFPPEVNGVAMTLGELTVGMARRGHDVSVVRPLQGTDRDSWDEFGMDHILVPGAGIPGYPELRFGYPARRRLVKEWESNRPNLVHVATEGPLGWSAVTAARRLGIPVTSSFHTNFHSYSRHYGLPFIKHLAIAYLRAFHNRTLRTFAPTPEVCSNLAAVGIRDLSVLGRGVNIACFSPEHRSEKLRAAWKTGDGPVVIYVGRLAAEKNIFLAIEAFQAVRKVWAGARFVLVGSGPLEKELRSTHPNFVFAGVRRGEDLAAHYASADLFLFPSLTETYGNVVTEAMASGLPVLAFDYAASGKHIRPWWNGVTVPFAQEAAFVAAANTMARRRAELPALGAVARVTVEGLTWERVIDEWEHALISIADVGPQSKIATPIRRALKSNP